MKYNSKRMGIAGIGYMRPETMDSGHWSKIFKADLGSEVFLQVTVRVMLLVEVRIHIRT
jgi:hypothetical protein